MNISKLFLLVSAVLCGCTSLESDSQYGQNDQNGKLGLFNENANASIQQSDSEQQISPLEASENFQNHYKNHFNSGVKLANKVDPKNRNINHYVQGIMQDLVGNLQSVSSATPMAVTSFVYLDSDYASADLLGKQIAESFIHEIHKFGIPIIDFKTLDYLRVTESGDFVLSRDFLELQANVSVQYVLLGTLTKSMGGVLVNARIVGMKSKEVVASAQGFLPSEVTKALLKSDMNDGIKIISE
ncbi:MAG: TolB-like protein [Paraglaciecola sp.]|jgi:TolB-like protein